MKSAQPRGEELGARSASAHGAGRDSDAAGGVFG